MSISSVFCRLIGFWATILLSNSCLIARVKAKEFTFPKGWTINNNKSLPEYPLSNGGIYRLLQDADGNAILSEEQGFGFGFVDPNGSGDFYLSVILGTNLRNSSDAAAAITVWTGNTNASVGDGATLMFAKIHAKFLLLDENGVKVWETPSNLTGLDLQESGNLVFFNGSGNVWQSFNNPTDTLVPGQKLKAGAQLISFYNKSSPRDGYFAAKMEASGLVLYLKADAKEQQPYYVWSLKGGTLRSALEPCSTFQAVFEYAPGAMNISYEKPVIVAGADTGCAQPKSIQIPQSASGNVLQFVRLESDGNMVVYQYVQKEWSKTYQLLQTSANMCKAPKACGAYGLCSMSDGCKCLQQTEGSVHSAETYVQSSSKCMAPASEPLICTGNEAAFNHFVNLTGTTYFSTSFSTPDIVSDLNHCLSACLSNCSCAALLYDRSSSFCFFLDAVLGSFTVESTQPQVSAFLKLRNSHLASSLPASITGVSKSSKSSRVAITALAVTCGFLLAALVVTCWLMREKLPLAYRKMTRQ